MNISPASYSNPLTFISYKPLHYGQSVTILEEPVRQNGHWIVNVLMSSPEPEEIILNTDQLIGKQFIIIRTVSSGNKFSHTAVLVDEINEQSRKIEDSISNLLKR